MNGSKNNKRRKERFRKSKNKQTSSNKENLNTNQEFIDEQKNRKTESFFQDESALLQNLKVETKEMNKDLIRCSKCNEPIQDIATAIAEKETGYPVHFDCVLKFLQSIEILEKNEKIIYIGQGRFAVVVFENFNDTQNFTIVRIIEWEEKEQKYEWRESISERYTNIK